MDPPRPESPRWQRFLRYELPHWLAGTPRHCLFFILYACCSAGYVWFNKWVLSPNHFDFPYPVTLAIIQAVFQMGAAFRFGFTKHPDVEPEKHYNNEFIDKAVFCLGIFLAVNRWLGDTAYMSAPPPSVQMLISLLLASTYLVRITQEAERMQFQNVLINLFIIGRVSLALYGQLHFNIFGTSSPLVVTIFEAQVLVLNSEVYHGGHRPFRPFTGMGFGAFLSYTVLVESWSRTEMLDVMNHHFTWRIWAILFLNGVFAPILYYFSNRAIEAWGTNWYQIAGIMKDLMVVASPPAATDSKAPHNTNPNVICILIASAGKLMYFHWTTRRAGQPKGPLTEPLLQTIAGFFL